jgi:hypothetical protein
MYSFVNQLATVFLQQQTAGEKGADQFWNTGPGQLIAAIMGAVGVVVVLVTAVKSFSFIGQGKPGQAFKSIIAAVAICVFLFRPETMNDLIRLVADLFDGIVGDADKLYKQVDENSKGFDFGSTTTTTSVPPASR